MENFSNDHITMTNFQSWRQDTSLSEYAWFGLGYLIIVLRQYPVKGKLWQNKYRRAVLLMFWGKVFFCCIRQ